MSDEKPINHIVYSKNVIEFITVATEFTTFLEKAPINDRKKFIEKNIKILALLYLKGSLLPKIEQNYAENLEKYVSEADYNFIKNRVEKILLKFDNFVDFHYPIEQESGDTINVSLSELFADIYQDMKEFLIIYNLHSVDIVNDALWECKNNFEQFWGVRTLALLTELHKLEFGDFDLEKNNEEIKEI